MNDDAVFDAWLLDLYNRSVLEFHGQVVRSGEIATG
jgi:hypothetical protein